MAWAVPLARRQLVHKPLQLAAALGGVAFATILVLLEVGLMLGMLQNASCIIDHAEADFWVMPKATPNFDFSRPMEERKVYSLKAVPGVKYAVPLTNFYSMCRTTTGEIINIMLVGFDPDTGVGKPWKMKEGRWQNVRDPDSVIVNDSDCPRLGVKKVGDIIEINNRRAIVAGISQEALNFTTSPNIFVSARQAEKYNMWLIPGQVTYLLVKGEPNVPLEVLRARLQQAAPDTDVLTGAEFSFQTKIYWMMGTGIGMLIGVSALLGLFVGTAIVTQILYSATVEHLPQYAVMKALGATDREVAGVLVRQGLWTAIFGFPIGWLLSSIASHAVHGSPMQILLPWWLVLGSLAMICCMCMGASLLPARKLARLEPGLIFRV
jgi:putative ABC transport system permease protein